MLASSSGEVPIRHCKGGDPAPKDVFSSQVRAKFYGSATKPIKITSSAQEGSGIEGKQVGLMEDLLPIHEGGSGSGISRAGGMYMMPCVGKMKNGDDGNPNPDPNPDPNLKPDPNLNSNRNSNPNCR